VPNRYAISQKLIRKSNYKISRNLKNNNKVNQVTPLWAFYCIDAAMPVTYYSIEIMSKEVNADATYQYSDSSRCGWRNALAGQFDTDAGNH
jgi:hypothetical protein